MQADGQRVLTSSADYHKWWAAFQDPVLDNLVQVACAQNSVPLRVAGARVFEARARLASAIGEQCPQVQQAVGSAEYKRESERGASAPQRSAGVDFNYKQVQVGVTASWELERAWCTASRSSQNPTATDSPSMWDV